MERTCMCFSAFLDRLTAPRSATTISFLLIVSKNFRIVFAPHGVWLKCPASQRSSPKPADLRSEQENSSFKLATLKRDTPTCVTLRCLVTLSPPNRPMCSPQFRNILTRTTGSNASLLFDEDHGMFQQSSFQARVEQMPALRTRLLMRSTWSGC